MRTITKNTYTFEELSEKAKENAISAYRNQSNDYFWCDDYRASLDAFANDFSIKITDWSISPYSYSYIDFVFTDHRIEELSGSKLRKYLYNYCFSGLYEGKYYGKLVDTMPDGNKIEKSKEYPSGMRHVKRHSKIFFTDACPTGYCADYDLRAPIYKFLKSKDETKTFVDLIRDCFESFADSWKSDMEYQDSDEYISELLIANDYEFDEYGNII